MIWEIRYKRDGFQVEAAIRKGRELPEWYEDEPYFEPTDVFYMKAFYDLSTCRINGMEIGSIPWTAMIKYSREYGLDPDVSEAFIDIMRSMDEAYIDHNRAERDKTASFNKPKPNRA